MSSVVKVALPILGAIVGSVIPGLGTALGASLGGAVGGYIGGRSYGGGNTGGLIGAAGGAAGGYLSGGYGASDWLGGLGTGAATTGATTEGASAALGTLGSGAGSSAVDGAGGMALQEGGSTVGLADAAAGVGGASGDMLAQGMGGPGTSLMSNSTGGITEGATGEAMAGGASGGAAGNNLSMLDRLKMAAQSKGAVRGGINVATGLWGLKEAQSLKDAADPFAKYRAGYGAQLAQLEANPSSMTTMPGYQAGLQAVQRAGAAQGYTGSGNMNAALAGYGQNFFQSQTDRLSGLAGAGAPPGQGAAAGYVAQNNAFKGIGDGLGGFFGG